MHDCINETSNDLAKIKCICSYVNLENDLIKLTGFNIKTLTNKLNAGYTCEELGMDPNEIIHRLLDWYEQFMECE